MSKWMKRGATKFLLVSVVKVTVMSCFISLPREAEYLFRCYEYARYLLEFLCFSVCSLTSLRLFDIESELKFVWMSRSDVLTGMTVSVSVSWNVTSLIKIHFLLQRKRGIVLCCGNYTKRKYPVWTERRAVSVRAGGTCSNHCAREMCKGV